MDCENDMSLQSRRVHAIAMIILEYFLPLAIIAYCNYRITRIIKTRRKQIEALQSSAHAQPREEQRKTYRY